MREEEKQTENNKETLIFSDESGAWGDVGNEFYVRSWLAISEEDYFEILEYYRNFLATYDIEAREIKWGKRGILIDHPELAEKLFENFQIIITFTKTGEFWERKFRLREDVLKFVQEHTFDDSRYIPRFSEKILNAINYVFFLNLYEKYHILNVVEKLNFSEEKFNFKIISDSPMFRDKNYVDLFKDIALDLANVDEKRIEIRFIDSKGSLGIQLADIVSGCFNAILKGEFRNNTSKEFFNKYIKKNLKGRGNMGTGIIKVMWDRNTDPLSELKKNIEVL